MEGVKMKPVLVGAALAGFAALGCESESQPDGISQGPGPTAVRVVAPDGRTFYGQSALAEVWPGGTGLSDTFNFYVRATDLNGGLLHVEVEQFVGRTLNPELIDVAIGLPPEHGAVSLAAEDSPLTAGRVHFELRAGDVTGRVEAQAPVVGTYTVDGVYGFRCFAPIGDHASAPDEGLETPLCQRFASLRGPNQ
jgi:hypothetical protein